MAEEKETLITETDVNVEDEIKSKKKMVRAGSPLPADGMERRYLLLAIPLVVSCCVYIATRSTATTRAPPTLAKVFLTFRHGSRAPMWTYKTDRYSVNNADLWPEGREKLTKRGKMEAYELGKRLRERYGEFLGEYYNSEELRAYSTLIERTIMSGQLVLSSFLPPAGYQLWNEALNWQPIPLYPEYIFNTSVGSRCIKYSVETLQTLGKISKTSSPQNSEMISLILKHAGEPNGVPFEVFGRVWDTTYFQDREGLPIPEWLKDIFPEKMSSTALKYLLGFVSGTDIVRKLVLYNYAVAVRDFLLSDDQRKMEIHSWHDLNNLALMEALAVPIEAFPEPTSCIAIELHYRRDKKYFEVYYYDSYKSTEPRLLEMPCGLSCSVEDLENMVKKHKLDNYTEVCQSGNLNEYSSKILNKIVV